MTNTVTVSAPPAGAVGSALFIAGTVSPTADTVQLQLDAQNTTLPTGVWAAGTTASNGSFQGTLVPTAGGTLYAWAYDPVTGAQAVSGAIVVPSPAFSYVKAAPIPVAQAASMLGGSAAGDTPDELPTAAPASDADAAIVAQGGRVLFAQPFSAIWTYISSKLTSWLAPQVNINANANLTNSAHNQRVLVVTATGVTLTALIASLGPGFQCTVLNQSGGTVTLSGVTTNTGAGTIANGYSARLTAFTNSSGVLVVFGAL